jgi:hypothetical protein
MKKLKRRYYSIIPDTCNSDKDLKKIGFGDVKWIYVA